MQWALKRLLVYLIRLAILALLLGIAWVGIVCLVQAVSENNLDGEFVKLGITVPGKIEGYEWVRTGAKSGRYVSGERPVVSYTTKDGRHLSYRAEERGAVKNSEKESLAATPIQVTYLASNSSIARVQAWYSSRISRLAFGGILILGLLVYMVFFLARGLIRGSISLSK